MDLAFNVVSSNVSKEDKELFFGPLTDEVFITLEPTDKWCHLLAKINFFPSIGQARKNGWDKDIPFGWTDVVMGKKKVRICILNLKEEVDNGLGQ